MYAFPAEDVLPYQQAELGGEFCEERGVWLEGVVVCLVQSFVVLLLDVDVVWLVFGVVVWVLLVQRYSGTDRIDGWVDGSGEGST